jgi:hypothetical protein
VTIPDAGRRRYAPITENSGRAHSVPRPAFGGAMLTLLRVRRDARLRRRPELDGASRPLHRAGSWQAFILRVQGWRLAIFLRPSGRTAIARRGRPHPLQSKQTTNFALSEVYPTVYPALAACSPRRFAARHAPWSPRASSRFKIPTCPLLIDLASRPAFRSRGERANASRA